MEKGFYKIGMIIVAFLCALLVAVYSIKTKKAASLLNETTETSVDVETESSVEKSNEPENSYEVSLNQIEEYALDFPQIVEAVLYKNGEPAKIGVEDQRLTKMINYIMFSFEENSAMWCQSPIPQKMIDSKISESDMYLTLSFNSETTAKYSRYNRGIIVGRDVIMIDDNTEGYYKPYNYTFTPYGADEHIVVPILETCGF